MPDGRNGPPIRTEVAAFLNGLEGCRSLLTVPLIKGKDIVGVLNIESPLGNLLGGNQDHAMEAAKTIQPLCTILAHVIS